MSKYDQVTPTELRELIDYNPETGSMTWRERPVSMFENHGGRYTAQRSWKMFNTKHAGQPAFDTLCKSGYHTGTLKGYTFSQHRVAWAYVHGYWPAQALDHINRDRADNRIENLRLSTGTLNNHNKKVGARVHQASGFVGVAWYMPAEKWVAYVSKNRKRFHVGYFDDPAEAALARDAKALELYGDYAFQNFAD